MTYLILNVCFKRFKRLVKKEENIEVSLVSTEAKLHIYTSTNQQFCRISNTAAWCDTSVEPAIDAS